MGGRAVEAAGMVNEWVTFVLINKHFIRSALKLNKEGSVRRGHRRYVFLLKNTSVKCGKVSVNDCRKVYRHHRGSPEGKYPGL